MRDIMLVYEYYFGFPGNKPEIISILISNIEKNFHFFKNLLDLLNNMGHNFVTINKLEKLLCEVLFS